MHLLIKNKLYRKVLLSNIFSTLGDSIYFLALLTYASQFKNAGLAITLVSLSESLPPLFELVTGSIADKSQNRVVKMIICGLMRALLYFIVGIMMGGSTSMLLLTGVVVINFISDLLGRYSSGLMTPFIRFIVPIEEIEEAQGISSGLRQTIDIFARFLGAFLVGVISYQFLAWINSGAFLIVIMIIWTMKNQLHKIEQKELIRHQKISVTVLFQQMANSLKELYHNKSIFRVLIIFGFSNGLISVTIPLISLLLAKNPLLAIVNLAFTIAFVQGSIVTAMLIGNVFGSRLAQGISLARLCQLMFFCLIVVGWGFIFMHIFLILAGLIVAGLMGGMASPKLNAQIIREISVERLATVSGGANTLLMVITPISMFIFPSLATFFNLEIAGISIVVVALICVCFAQIQIKKEKISS